MTDKTISDLMTRETCVVARDTNIVHAARIMLEQDIGAIPVVEGGKPVGIITDRDIVCRSLGKGEDPMGHTVEDYMTPTVVCVKQDASLQDCLNLMEEHRIRRMLVVDEEGQLCGIVAQADIARECSVKDTAELLEKVSV